MGALNYLSIEMLNAVKLFDLMVLTVNNYLLNYKDFVLKC